MAGMIEVAKATVTIVPNMQGSQKAITEGLASTAATAGEKAGSVAGSNMGKSIGKAIAGTAIAAKVGKGIADSWKEVDAAMDTVAIKTGATGTALEGLTDSMKKVASSLPTDFEAAGDAVGEVNTKFQLTGAELEELSGQFIKFAKINDTDVKTSVDNVANTLAAFGEDSSHASQVLDAMNAAGQATGIGMDDLGKALQKNAAVFNEMGMSVEQAAGLMATFNTAGLTTADTSTALRTAMKNATKDGVTMNEALKEFGTVMQSNVSDTEKLQAAIGLFGSKAGPAIYNAFENGKISIEDFSAALVNSAGSVSETFEATLDPTDRFQQAMNGLKTVGAELVEAIMPAFTMIADVAVPAISKAAEAFSALPDGVKTAIVAFAGITAVAGPVISLGSKLTSGFSGIAGAFGKIAGSAGSAASGLGSIGSSAASAAGGAASAAAGFSSMAGAALMIVAVGAGFALVGAGMKLMADAAVEIGNAGFPAAAAMLEIVAAVAALMGVAAVTGPVLTASAAGIAAFGLAVAAIGAGIALATTGIALMAEAFSHLLANVKTAGEGMNLIVDAIKRLSDMNLKDIALSLGTAASGIKDISKNAKDIDTTATAMDKFATSLSELDKTAGSALPGLETMMNNALKTVKSNLKEMQDAFKNTKFEFGQIKLPHFSMSGNFNPENGSVPKVSVKWYARAAEQGALFSSPQLIGVGDASQPEMLIGERTLYENIRDAVSQNNGDVYVYIGDQQLDAIISRSNQRMAMRRGLSGNAY